MGKKRIVLLLVGIFLLGFALRVWNVGNHPPLLWDEAALGYNAYSILKTGKDEWGKVFPLVFRSFGDYKPGLYVYLTVPFVAIMGLNDWAVRLPSVIAGSLSPLLLFLLVRQIFGKDRLAWLSALVLALLPWSIHFSRGAWEANVMVFFLLLGSWLWLKGSRFSLLPFLLALLTYQGAKMLVPLVLLVLIFCQPVKLDRFKLGVGGLMLLWFGFSLFGPTANRLKVLSLFSYQRPEAEVEMIQQEDGQADFHFFLFHGEWLHRVRGFSVRYLNHFSPDFLAFSGDWSNPRHSAPYFGVIGHLNFIFLIFGLILFLLKKRKKKEYLFLVFLLLAPLPAALTRDIISGVRSLWMIVPIAFFVAYGIDWLADLKNVFLRRAFLLATFLFLFLDLFYWWDLYTVHMVAKSPIESLYGYRQAVDFIHQRQDQYDQVLVGDFYGQPYIYYLFYTQYPPKLFQARAVRSGDQSVDVGRVAQLDNIYFALIGCRQEIEEPKTLSLLSEDEVFRLGMDPKSDFFVPVSTIGSRTMFFAHEEN
ncbi:MAG: phospholipid carrier-dependent glycosyltransferase [Patescibacteria group bacterium]